MRADTVDRMLDAFFGDDRSYGTGELDDYRRRMDDALTAALSQEPVDGYTCHSCGLRYRGDLLVPDDVWVKISPISVDGFKGGGLLCPSCIMNRIIDAGIWTAARAFDVASPVEPVAAKAEAEVRPSELDFYLNDAENGICRIPRALLSRIRAALGGSND